jgi:hypothetical protein
MKKIIENFELSPMLFDLVEGKRVALVGPAPYLLGHGLGSEIDGYDVVCRVTDLMPQFRADYGSRTDILFDACDYRAVDNGLAKISRSRAEAEKIKLLYLPWADLNEEAHKDRLSIFDVRERIYDGSGLDLSWTHISKKNFALIQNEVGCEPNSGLLAMIILLSHHVKELLVTGMTFYLDADKPENCYYPNYLEGGLEKLMEQPNFFDGHMQMPQIAFFVTEIMKECVNVLSLDSYFQGLLNSATVELNKRVRELGL